MLQTTIYRLNGLRNLLNPILICNEEHRFIVAEQMREIDTISIVSYDHSAKVVVPSQKVENKGAINAAINMIVEGGSTNLHQGWLLGAEEVAKNKSSQSLNRVLLLSDGNANQGETSENVISDQCSPCGFMRK